MLGVTRWKKTALVWLFVVIVCGILWVSYRQYVAEIRQEAELQQRQRAVRIAFQLEANLYVTAQIARSLADAAPILVGKRENLESLLRSRLDAAPKASIYGIGVWFEPYQFSKQIQYFGPYVHRASADNAPPVLTYEWTTQAYDFPSRDWYKAGRDGRGRVVFTEPYYDAGLVYMSAVKAFYGRADNFLGVVTVDMLLGQLEEIIAAANKSPLELIYLTSARNNLLAHPLRDELLGQAKLRGQPVSSILDLTYDDWRYFMANQPRGDWRDWKHTEILVEGPGWTLHVETSPRLLEQGGQDARHIVLALVSLSIVMGLTLTLFFGKKVAA